MRVSLFLAFLGLFLSHTCSFAEDHFVVRSNTSVKVYLDNPEAKDLKNAFNQLKKYVFETVQSKCIQTDCLKSSTAIYLKQNKQLHPDGFIISIRKKQLIIEGGTRKGATYAVIHLLKTYLGCDYPGPNFRVIPKRAAITLPCKSIKEKPANDTRIINLYYPENPEYRDWLHLQTIEEIYPEGYFVHTFHRLIPWQEYFQQYPEYFALVNGKRSIDQLCTTNPEVRQLIVQKLKTEMERQPDKQKWSVSQNDNFSYCQCDACHKLTEAEGSPSGPIMHLVNEIAAQFPDKIISTLAYQYSRQAPKQVKPLKNVEVMLCTIELHRQEAIETNPECEAFKKDMEDWGKICSNIFLWDYTINFNHSISPFPNLHTLGPNIRFFTKNHVNALFEQSNSTTGYEFSELKAYLLSRLMWNPDSDLEAELNYFLEQFYGNASPLILSYIKTLESDLRKSGSKLWIYEHPVVHQNGLFSEENIEKYKQLFDEAERLVANDPVLLNHVRLARLPLQYAEMELAANNMFSDRGWYQLINGKAVPAMHLWKTLDDFEQTTRLNQVPTINEAELSPENYIRSLRSMIDINIEGNEAFEKKVSASPLPDKKYQNGDLSYLTNGVNGASDYNIHWLGWFGTDAELILDLEKPTEAATISMHSLWNGKSWILHPAEVECSVSADGITYSVIGTIAITGEQQQEAPIHDYLFHPKDVRYRYVKMTVKGTKKLFDWHPSAGEPSWFFLDEIQVRD